MIKRGFSIITLIPRNHRIRLLVGVFLAGLFCIHCTHSEAVKSADEKVVQISGRSIGSNSPEVLEKIDKLAKSNHVALLEYCLDNYEGRYADYTCTFIKQERMGGKLGAPQVVEVKFMEDPFSVFMKWVENIPMAERILYVEGEYDNKMLIKLKSSFLRMLAGTVKRDPAGKEVMEKTRRPVTMFGFKRAMKGLLDVYSKAAERGDLKQSFGGYVKINGREAVVLVRNLPPEKDYETAETRTYIDLQYLVPIKIEGTNWDGQLTGKYVYRDINFNVGLTQDDFLPEACGIEEPR